MRSASTPPLRQVHDEVRTSVGELADVVDRDDVRAADAAQQLRLADEALARRRVVRVFGREDLDGDVRVERFVERGHDDTEPADTEHRDAPDTGRSVSGKPFTMALGWALRGGRTTSRQSTMRESITL